jgi:MFS family permease
MSNNMSSSGTVTPLPLSQILTVVFINMCEGLNVNVLFPFLAFMVEDFGYEGHRLGYYAGMLAASFCGAQFFSSYFWGKISDRYGRKPAMILGLFGAAVGMAIFGTSKIYAQAVAGRLIAGFLSGNLGIIKTYLTEITDDSNRVNGFAYMSLASQIGNILGPMAGGLLSNPAEQYPEYFSPHSVFAEYPYLLPCLLCVACNLTATLVTALLMQETRWKAYSNSNEDSASDSLSVEMTLSKKSGDSHGVYKIVASSDDKTESEDCSEKDDSSLISDEKAVYRFSVASGSEVLKNESFTSDESLSRLIDSEGSDSAPSPSVAIEIPTADETGSDETNKSALRERSVILSTLTYGLLAMGYVILDETLPLFMKQPVADGGFGFKSYQIGFVLSSTGAVMLLFTVTVLPAVSKRGKLWLFRTSNWFGIPFILAWPTLSIVNRIYLRSLGGTSGLVSFWMLLLGVSTIKNVIASFTFTAVSFSASSSVSFFDVHN